MSARQVIVINGHRFEVCDPARVYHRPRIRPFADGLPDSSPRPVAHHDDSTSMNAHSGEFLSIRLHQVEKTSDTSVANAVATAAASPTPAQKASPKSMRCILAGGIR